MKLKLHHLNLSTDNVAAMKEFYSTVLEMRPDPSRNAARDSTQGYPGNVAFMTDGQSEVHLAERDLKIGFRTGQVINPLERGHIAFRTDDIAGFKKRLDEMGVAYADFGAWAMKGWQQIYFYDPDGNIIEVHEAKE